MSVSAPIAGEVFTIVTQKYHTGNPSQKWINTWEVIHDGSSDYAGLVACKDAICQFEMDMAATTIYLEKSRISTFVPEAGYDPTSFVTSDENLPGQLSHVSDPLDLRAALFVRRQVAFGRQGKLFLRGFWEETNIDSIAGEWRISNQAGLNTNMQGLIGSSGLINHINALGVPPAYSLVLARREGTFTQTRYVTGMEIAGVAWNKMQHNPRRGIT